MSAKKHKSPRPPAPGARPTPGRPAPGRHTAAGDLHGASDWRAIVALAVVLLLAGGWAYSSSFEGVLVLDDIRAIARNPTIRSFSSALVPPGESTVAGRPVANLSLAINYALAPAGVRDQLAPPGPGAAPARTEAFLQNVWGYHLLNLLVHLAAGLLLFGCVRRTLLSPRLRHVFASVGPGPADQAVAGAQIALSAREQPATWIAFVAALVWLVHPLQTEAVTYLVQRVESLMGLFYLLTLYCAIRAADAPRRGPWSAGAIAACALGMATKEVMVTAPVTVWLWDWLFLAPRKTEPKPVVLHPRLALYAGLASTWVILGALVLNEHRAPSVDVGQGMVWRYLATQAGVIVHYLRLAFVPSPLVFLYTWPIAPSLAAVAPQVALLVALVALTIVGLVRRNPLAFAGAWFLLILAPTSSLLPIVTEVAAEHRMYLPLAAVIAVVVVGAFLAGREAVRRVSGSSRDGAGGRTWRRAGIAAAALATIIAVVGLGAMTRDRNRDYWSDETLWRDTVEKQPANPRARIAYGVTLFGQRRLAEAEVQLRAAVGLTPADPVALARLGAVLAAQGRLDEAVLQLQGAADLTSHRDVQVLSILAAAQAESGRSMQAAATANEALQAARAQGRDALADELARRVAAYRAMSAAGR